MYKRFFGLKANPFNPNPDPRFLFLTGATREALAALAYGIRNRKGFLLLTGEVGTGKTTLINRLLEWLNEEKVATAFIFNSRLNEGEFFDFVLNDFGIPCESRIKSQRLIQLNQWLLDRYRERQTAVLIVDEAQNLSNDVLEEVRLLTNMETTQEKLLQIVLSGQPELEEKLRDPSLRQLRQRITIRCSTAPLSRDEMQSYVAERLRVAGANGTPIFSVEAIDAVYKHSQGIPRIANLLCEHSLINAFVDQLRPIPPQIVDDVSREFEFQRANLIAQQLAEHGASQEEIVEAVVHKLQELVDRVATSKSAGAAAGNSGAPHNPSPTSGFKIPS
jgi:general secretion pathway protein A